MDWKRLVKGALVYHVAAALKFGSESWKPKKFDSHIRQQIKYLILQLEY